MNPSDTGNPNYFHKVVDCQWACPAHTNVPEYIRLIAQGRYTDAYMVNRESNVFPASSAAPATGPASPPAAAAASRGSRSRSAASSASPPTSRATSPDLLPRVPQQKTASASPDRRRPRLAHRRQRPDAAWLRGHDLREVRQARRPDAHQHPRPFGSPSRSSTTRSAPSSTWASTSATTHPSRACGRCSSEEFRRRLRRQRRAAGQGLELPGRHDSDRIHIGIDWLESVAFGHIDSIGERVLIIGVGNTAMDCCRSSRRLGGKDVKVMARRPRGYFKASPWELEDAEEEASRSSSTTRRSAS